MKLIEKTLKKKKIKLYGLWKLLTAAGINVSYQGLNGYRLNDSKAMRLDILCGIRKEADVSWEEFGSWIEEEFLLNQKKNKK